MENEIEKAKMTVEALVWITKLLNDNNIPYQVSGGLAAKIYGSNRPLNDIDLDVPRSQIDRIAELTKEYVTYGPVQHKDEKWDLYIVALDYKGQEIDIGEAENARIFDEAREEWVSAETDLVKANNMNYEGIDVQVMRPQELATYKKLLNGPHQKADIEAVEKYIDCHK